MPDEAQYAERTFAAGLGRRAVEGRCADCSEVSGEELLCEACRVTPGNQTPAARARQAGHRERMEDLHRGVRDPALTIERVNAISRDHLAARLAEIARAATDDLPLIR